MLCKLEKGIIVPLWRYVLRLCVFFFQAEDGIRDLTVTGVQTCALPIYVLVAEQSAGYLTLLRDDGEGRAKWIDRHVEDLNRPYGLAWRDDGLLVADQDGIWRVPHVVGALRAGRPQPPQRADQVPADKRKPITAAYGAQMLT